MAHARVVYVEFGVGVLGRRNWQAVRKNTSLPLGVASRNADSRLELPEEINDTQPPEPASRIFRLRRARTSYTFSTPTGRLLPCTSSSRVPAVTCGMERVGAVEANLSFV